MNAKKERTQSRSIGLVALVNIFNAVIGISQAFVVGRLFGTTSGVEIFFAASGFSLSIGKLLQAGQIAEIFIPAYHQIKETEGIQVGFDLLAVLLNWMLLAAISISTIMFFGAQTFVPMSVPGFSSERTATCVTMFQLLIPLITLQVARAMLSNLLTSEKQFVAQEVTRALCGLVSLALIVVFAARFDAWVMIGSQWVASVITVVVFLIYLRRIGYRHCFRLKHDKFEISSIFKKLPSIFGYVCVTQVYSLIIIAGLSVLPQGSLAVYNYAVRIYTRVAGILVRPVSTVFFSHFSTAVAQGDQAIHKITAKALRLMLILSTLTCAIAVVAGLPALRALWLSEKFPETQVFQTYLTFATFCFIPVFSGLGLIFRKMNMAHQFTHSQYMMLVANQSISAVVAYFLIPAWGLAGAVAIAIGNPILGAIASGCLLKFTHSNRFTIYDRKTIYQCLALFLLTAVPLLCVQHLTGFYQLFPNSRIGNVISTGILACVSIVAMGVIARVLKVEEFQSGQRMVTNRLKNLLNGSFGLKRG